jgi:hypothetical protein
MLLGLSAQLFASYSIPADGASFFADLCDEPFSYSLLSVPNYAARIGQLRDSA